MRVVVTVGLPGSGKSEAAAVARDLDVPVVTMGDVIRQECRDRGLDPAADHGEVAKRLREENGPAAVAERALPIIEEALEASDTVLVDGLRSDVELDQFLEAFGDAVELVCIEAPRSTRAERLDDRGRDAGVESLAERDERELEFGMGAAMERAGVTIENDGSLEEFREAIRELLTDQA